MTYYAGSQQPTYRWCPEYESTAGREAFEFGRSVGLIPDPWQRFILNDALAEVPGTTRWAHNEVGVIVGRQNGKGAVIELRELAGLFVFGERFIMHSAHEFKTAGDAFRRMKTIVESNADLDRKVHAVANSKGQEGFTFKIDGKYARLNYFARSSGSGRGFTQCDCVILDEAMILDEGPIAAMLPTMATAPNWQVWYTASAGDRKLRTESRVLARIRRRGHKRDPSLTFHEWSAHLTHTDTCPEDCVADRPDDPRTWAKTNPTMNIVRPNGTTGVTEEFLRKMQRSMSSWDFNREFLGVGDYPSDDGWNVFSPEQWDALYDPSAIDAGAPRPFTVAIESTWDREVTSVAVVAVRPDGKWHWELIARRPGTEWVVDYCRELRAKKPTCFAVDPKGPANILIDDLEFHRLKPFLPTFPQLITAAGRIHSVITETRQAAHLGDDRLLNAVKHVEKRDLPEGQFVYKRTDTTGDVSPFLALWVGMAAHAAKGRSRASRPLVGAV